MFIQHCLPAKRGSGGEGVVEEREDRTTDRAQGDGERRDREEQMLGEMGGRQTIDRQTDIPRRTTRERQRQRQGEMGGGGGRETDRS